jgi:hypothetical protein
VSLLSSVPIGHAVGRRAVTVVRFVTILTAALAAACTDAPTGPDIIVTDGPHPRAEGDAATFAGDFTVDPAVGGAWTIRDNVIVFPAGSICDPARSSYGAEHWDEPCPPLAAPITIHVAAHIGADGHWVVDFTPALRFLPSDDPSRWVMLYMKDADHDPSSDGVPPILWLAPNGSWVDESLGDPTLVTRVAKSGNIVYRRVEHFSGYMVGASRRR